MLRTLFGPPAAVPTDGLSSHMTHLIPCRTRAKDSIIFLQAPSVVLGGVEASEAYLTGIWKVSIYRVAQWTYIVKDVLDHYSSSVSS
jgi:hypothetical protein